MLFLSSLPQAERKAERFHRGVQENLQALYDGKEDLIKMRKASRSGTDKCIMEKTSPGIRISCPADFLSKFRSQGIMR
ncbi:MAG: hypothetical protein QXP27_03670 [Candidatus Methanomethyliaceae archaeon]